MKSLFVFVCLTMALSAVAIPGKNAKVGPGLDAQLSIAGYVSESGRKVAGAKVLLICPHTNFQTETTTSTAGKYSFNQLPPESYQVSTSIHGKTAGFSVVLSEKNVQQDLAVE